MASHGGHWALGGGPWRGRIIWLGRLGASWKEDKQGVRIWGQAESTVRSQLTPAPGSLQLPACAQGWPSPVYPVGASHPHPSLFCPNSLRAESVLPLFHM